MSFIWIWTFSGSFSQLEPCFFLKLRRMSSFFFGARLAYNFSGYGVTLLSGSIAAQDALFMFMCVCLSVIVGMFVCYGCVLLFSCLVEVAQDVLDRGAAEKVLLPQTLARLGNYQDARLCVFPSATSCNACLTVSDLVVFNAVTQNARTSPGQKLSLRRSSLPSSFSSLG